MLCLNEVIDYEKIQAKIIYYTREERRTPAHWHTNLEIKYIARGINDIFVDGRKYELCPGDIGVVNRGMVHFSKQVGADSIGGLTIVYSNEYLERFCPDFDTWMFEPVLSEERTPEAFAVVRRLYGIYERQHDRKKLEENSGAYGYIEIRGLLDLLMYQLMTSYRTGRRQNADSCGARCRERYLKAAEYIEKNYKERLTLNQVAEREGLSREYFSRSFKQYMGMTFAEYVSDIRLSEAYRQLMSTDDPVLDVALSSGFPDARAFCRCFREQYGVLPSEYRKMNQKI